MGRLRIVTMPADALEEGLEDAIPTNLRRLAGMVPRPEGMFRAGNQYAKTENLTPEAHQKRMAALFKGWSTRSRRDAGEKLVETNKKRKAAKRRRVRLTMTTAKEAREIQLVGRQHAMAAMKRLAEIAETSNNETAAIAAASVLLDRTYGKATQTNVNANLDANGKTTDISGKELDRRTQEALTRIEAFTGGKTKAPKGEKRPADLREHNRDPNSSSLH